MKCPAGGGGGMGGGEGLEVTEPYVSIATGIGTARLQ